MRARLVWKESFRPVNSLTAYPRTSNHIGSDNGRVAKCAADFDSAIPRFESWRPNLADLAPSRRVGGDRFAEPRVWRRADVGLLHVGARADAAVALDRRRGSPGTAPPIITKEKITTAGPSTTAGKPIISDFCPHGESTASDTR